MVGYPSGALPLTADGARAHTLGYGSSVFSLLEQDVWWINRDGGVEGLESMGSTRARALLNYLRRRAPLLPWQHVAMSCSVLGMLQGEMATDIATNALDREFDEILADPAGWLEERPLVKKLRAVIELRAYVGSGPEWWE